MLKQFKGCRVQPLQIVEEQCQWVLRPGECADKPPKHQLEAILRVLRRKLGNGRLFPDDKLERRNQVDDELTVWTHSLPQRVLPMAHLRITLSEDLINKGLKGLRERPIRDVPFVLVEFAGRAETLSRNEMLIQLIQDRGISDAGI